MKAMLSAWLISLFTTAAVAFPYGPGDGPTPAVQVSLPLSASPIYTYDGLRSFTYWEKTQRLLYETEESSVNEVDFRYRSWSTLSRAIAPVSRVSDPREEILLFEGSPIFVRVQNGSGYRQSFLAGPLSATRMHHLFWHDDTLYSFAESPDGKQLYAFQRNQWEAAKRCAPLKLEPEVRIASGAGMEYPNVLLFTSRRTRQGETLYFRRFDVSECRLGNWEIAETGMPGRALRVVKLGHAGGYAVVVEHRSLRVLWHSPTLHALYEVHSSAIDFPNTNLPVLQASDGKGGLALLSLERARWSVLHVPQDLGRIFPRGSWLTSDGAHLLVPHRSDCQTRLVDLRFAPLR